MNLTDLSGKETVTFHASLADGSILEATTPGIGAALELLRNFASMRTTATNNASHATNTKAETQSSTGGGLYRKLDSGEQRAWNNLMKSYDGQ